jgi:catechol 2,3-dioxygenase
MASAGAPSDTRIGTIRLRVRNLRAETRFYRDLLGFSVVAEEDDSVSLGTEDGPPLLILLSCPEGTPRPGGSTGLFHAAFLLPGRQELAALIRRVGEQGGTFDGFSDHHVSEAAYLRDPEGNGLELYADRPKDRWRAPDGRILLTTQHLDVGDLLREAAGPATALPRLPRPSTWDVWASTS